MKGVILAGGTGSRLHPFTKYLNKHLLPVGPYPMIYWSIIKLRDAGIKDILIITNKHHLSSFIELLGQGEELQVKIQYQIQSNLGGGIADALISAKNFINSERFVVILGDNIFKDALAPYVQAFQKQESGARVLLKEEKDLSRFGVPQLDETNTRILAIIEKPTNPPSNYCVTGVYMYDPKVFDMIESITPSQRNELEITDVNNLYIKESQLQYNVLNGWWIDAGTHDSLYQANKCIYESMIREDSQ